MNHLFKDTLIKLCKNIDVILGTSNINNTSINFYEECITLIDSDVLINYFTDNFTDLFDDIINMDSTKVNKGLKNKLSCFLSKDIINSIFSSRIVSFNKLIIWNYLLKLCEISLDYKPDERYITKVKSKLDYIDSMFK